MSLLRRAASALPALAVLSALSALGGCALLAPATAPAPAVTPAPAAALAPAPDTAAARAAAAPAASARVLIDAPSALRPLLERHLDIVRLQELPDDETLGATEWARLIAATPAQVRELLQTEGYFDPRVTVQRLDGTPAHVQVSVQPGTRVRIGSLRLDFEGELSQRLDAGDADALALRAALEALGRPVADAPFRNPAWADTKQALVGRLRAAGYAGALLNGSNADIDLATQRAALFVVLDSGPLFRAGEVQVRGLAAHDAQTVRHLAGFSAGAPLTEVRLLEYQERLLQTGLFDAVSVGFDPAASGAAAAPVLVRVTEKPLRQATVGLGYSANTGPRATLEHHHRRLLGRPLTAYNKLEWGRDSQTWSGDLLTHPAQGFYRNLLGVQIERVKSDTDIVLSQRLRLGRTQDTPQFERLLFAELLRSRQSDAAGVSTAEALSANLHLVWRQLDSQTLPTRGYSLSVQSGAGQARAGSGHGPFGRLYGRFTGYLPLGAQWYGQARLEAGQVIKREQQVVPDALGFRAGGDDSVRGYGYRELAPVDASGNTISGSLLLTSSLELARPVSPALPAVWGAVFVDAGRAVDRWTDYSAAWGYGVGVRWRSPIGPLRADLAYGQELRRLRLHMSVGIAF
ncbi:autotransporter assembly complex protein TamA [Aquabacterium sp. OR-4]|uniref:autotransporter assembly complex protein TamA n=1 Tax=Aquabacterium sp. OR-4 TaxID=2978127 RepID=UPI0021B45B05|nr:BamA/TamA family outer membrane protein [Aquabacterium sp. OR-4]MDT7835821.1 BamA/TamA family outer membrane protein [Aquabacterium sp. OR-4]